MMQRINSNKKFRPLRGRLLCFILNGDGPERPERFARTGFVTRWFLVVVGTTNSSEQLRTARNSTKHIRTAYNSSEQLWTALNSTKKLKTTQNRSEQLRTALNSSELLRTAQRCLLTAGKDWNRRWVQIDSTIRRISHCPRTAPTPWRVPPQDFAVSGGSSAQSGRIDLYPFVGFLCGNVRLFKWILRRARKYFVLQVMVLEVSWCCCRRRQTRSCKFSSLAQFGGASVWNSGKLSVRPPCTDLYCLCCAYSARWSTTRSNFSGGACVRCDSIPVRPRPHLWPCRGLLLEHRLQQPSPTPTGRYRFFCCAFGAVKLILTQDKTPGMVTTTLAGMEERLVEPVFYSTIAKSHICSTETLMFLEFISVNFQVSSLCFILLWCLGTVYGTRSEYITRS